VAASAWEIAAIALKALTYAATLGAAGAVFFLRHQAAIVTDALRLVLRRRVPYIALLAVAAGAAHIMAIAASMSGGAAGMHDGPLIHMILQTGAGRANALRALGLLLAAVGVMPRRPPAWALLGAAMAATSFAWTGHGQALGRDGYPVLLLGVHLLAAAFWLGALAPLALIARDGDVGLIASAAGRFSAAAVIAVGVMVAAAASLLWMMLGGFGNFFGSAYGRLMAVKLTFVAAMLCLAAFNRWRLTPRLQRGDARAVRGLRFSIHGEMLLATLILTATAVLTSVSGPPALE
jgi:putative copper export protein